MLNLLYAVILFKRKSIKRVPEYMLQVSRQQVLSPPAGNSLILWWRVGGGGDVVDRGEVLCRN